MNEDNNGTITLMHPCLKLHVGLINIPLQCETYCLMLTEMKRDPLKNMSN